MLPQELQTTFAMEYFAIKFWGGIFLLLFAWFGLGFLCLVVSFSPTFSQHICQTEHSLHSCKQNWLRV